MPEPSSIVTKSSATTVNALSPVDGNQRERRLVARADELGDRNVADDRRVVAEHVGDACAREHEVASAFGRAHADVRRSSGPTAAPTFDGSVHGVVVHTSEVVVAADRPGTARTPTAR